MASGAVLLLRKLGVKEFVSVNRGLLLNLCTLRHSSSLYLDHGLFCRYKSHLGLLNRLLFLSESCPSRANLHCPTSNSPGHALLAVMCLLPVRKKSNMRCHDLGTVECKYCIQNSACMSTKVSGDKKTGTDTSANDEGFGDTNVKSRLGQTKQLIKETTDKVKYRMEAIIMRENIMTIPNMLCITRIMLSPFLGYLVLQRSFDYALGVFVFAGLTDLLDGFIARNFKNQQSMLGSFLDPMADKFLVFFLVLSLTCRDLLPVPLTVLIIARDACLLIAGFYIRFLSLPPPKTLSRYFDISYATAQLSPTFISKVNTLVQLSLVACSLASPLCHLENHSFIQAFWYLTAMTTVASGLSYLFSKNTYHLLRQIQDKKRR